MKPKTHNIFLFTFVTLVLLLSACTAPGTLEATATSPATNTAAPTLTPTKTPSPTATPNATATELADRGDQMRAEVQTYVDAGYLSTVDGTYLELPDFEQEWAQIGWFQWWSTDIEAPSTFVLSAHFKWSSAIENPDPSGCGIAFDTRGDYTQGVIFLDRSSVVALNFEGGTMPKTKGTGRINISFPAEADLTVVANQDIHYVLVNNEFIGQYGYEGRYGDESFSGPIGYSVLSGTNKDYGTRCEITHVRLWKIK